MHMDAVYKINMVTLAFRILANACMNVLEKQGSLLSLRIHQPESKFSFNRNNIKIASNNVNSKFNKLLSARKITNNLITPTLCGPIDAHFLWLVSQKLQWDDAVFS